MTPLALFPGHEKSRLRWLKAAGVAVLVLTLLLVPGASLLQAVGPSYPGEPTIDPRQRALPLAAFGWLARPRIIAAIVVLTLVAGAAALLLLRFLQARQTRVALGQDKLELLARHAERLELLYRRYATLYPKQAEFWSLLASDETKHARWVREVFAAIAGGQVVFAGAQFPVAEIEASLGEIETLLAASADPAAGDPLRGYQNAAAIEGGRSQWQIQDFFSGPERQLQGLALFHAEILAHRERLEELRARGSSRAEGS